MNKFAQKKSLATKSYQTIEKNANLFTKPGIKKLRRLNSEPKHTPNPFAEKDVNGINRR